MCTVFHQSCHCIELWMPLCEFASWTIHCEWSLFLCVSIMWAIVFHIHWGRSAGEGPLGHFKLLIRTSDPCFVQLLFKNDVHFRLEPPAMTTGQLPTLINLYMYCTSGNEYTYEGRGLYILRRCIRYWHFLCRCKKVSFVMWSKHTV